MNQTLAKGRAVILSRRRPGLATRIFEALLTWQQRQAERRHLAMLDDYLLRDVGLSRADVEQESSKPFWRD